ncbi:hypothetical protein QA601_15210 [Chitinispirillales bacterium ANBcel5]|uniref:hypothetical protein n=1 Tax=Cellulosispirillum alkaliphilum TaxID=3039283 RepID=UPI002A526285|nr:hypothetical protein [Chitinispirillales bacterium ANBcel5]
MTSPFTPIENPSLFCRFCSKIVPAQLDRGIAENGKTIDKKSTFEYSCSKCFKTSCYCGKDLLEINGEDETDETRTYSPREHYFIGEEIFHKTFDENGLVVGKENGSNGKILVHFEKAGLKKLIQDI